MMNNNKILTVSYGTFSCTLEGFDDSFGTMKAIAEYFRDLAAEDRYFGAEPPQPDAEMLARIAQKEMTRRVHARQQDGTIVLSALEDHPQETENAPQAVPAQDVSDVAPAVPTVTAEAEATAPQEETQAALSDLDISAALARETAPEAEAEDTPSEAAQHEATHPEAAQAEAVDEGVQAAVSEEEDENDIVPGQPDKDVEAFFAEGTNAAQTIGSEDVIEAEQIEDADAPKAQAEPETPAASTDSIAAKLQRIRAVVAQQDHKAGSDSYLEDEHAAGTAPRTKPQEDAIAQARDAVEEASDIDDATEAAAQTATIDDDNNIEGILDRLQEETSTTPQTETPSESAAAPEGNDTVNNLFEPTLEEADTPPPVSKPLRRPKPNVIMRKPQPAKPAQREARVVKVKRSDLQSAIDTGALEEYDDESTTNKTVAKEPEAPKAPPALDDIAPARNAKTSLSPQEEAELARELAELEEDIRADQADENVDVDQPDQSQKGQRSSGAGRELLPSIDEGEGADMSRLLAEADHQMDEPESATRRDAFAHLRAAVAAKKADDTIDDGKGKDQDGDYRNDLADVVRPRRPVAGRSRTERPEEPRPAPLKLVAEQRIDKVASKPAEPVRPRRVSAQPAAKAPAVNSDSSFADYAADVGASTLPQMLEAAASYMSFVEGHEQFSRPQLMTKVRQAGGQEEFSREEGLRSFGQLLRTGKIEKIKGGRFTVSDDIGFRPDERAAG